jgi:hypothetical protein
MLGENGLEMGSNPQGAQENGCRIGLALERNSLINEHDGDIIFDRIHELALIADESVTTLVKSYIAFAFRTAKDIEEILLHGHLSLR